MITKSITPNAQVWNTEFGAGKFVNWEPDDMALCNFAVGYRSVNRQLLLELTTEEQEYAL